MKRKQKLTETSEYLVLAATRLLGLPLTESLNGAHLFTSWKKPKLSDGAKKAAVAKLIKDHGKSPFIFRRHADKDFLVLKTTSKKAEFKYVAIDMGTPTRAVSIAELRKQKAEGVFVKASKFKIETTFDPKGDVPKTKVVPQFKLRPGDIFRHAPDKSKEPTEMQDLNWYVAVGSGTSVWGLPLTGRSSRELVLASKNVEKIVDKNGVEFYNL
jgi:hypothetical protein